MKSRAWQVMVACGALMGGACAVDNQQEMALYRQVLDEGRAPATQPYRADQPLPLSRALAMALAGDERLAVAGEKYLQGLIDKDRAAAAFLPTIALVPMYTAQKQTKYARGNPQVAQFAPPRTLDAPVAGTMRFDVVRDWDKIAQAAQTAEERRHLLLDLRAAVLLDVARSYYLVVQAERSVEVLAQSLVMQQQAVKDMRAKVDAGVMRRLDLAQSEAQASGVRVQLLQAQNAARTGRQTLAFLVGVPRVEGPLVDDLTIREPGEVDHDAAWEEAAANHREDLLAARAAVEAEAQGVRAAWGGYFPTVSLNLAGYLTRQTFPDDASWVSVVQVYAPIFTAGLVYADVRTAWSRLRQAQFREARLRREVGKDLRVALDDLRSSREQVAELRVQAAAADRAAGDAENAYAAGTATNLERLTARDRLLTAQLQLTTEELVSKVAYLNLLRVAGQLTGDLLAPPDAAGAALQPGPASRPAQE